MPSPNRRQGGNRGGFTWEKERRTYRGSYGEAESSPKKRFSDDDGEERQRGISTGGSSGGLAA